MGGGGGGKGGGGSSTSSKIEVINSGTTNVDVDSTVEVQGLDNIQQKLTLDLPQPLKTESRQELAVTQPIVTDSRNAMALDIRPMTVDLCLNVNLGPPAPTCVRQPYHHHFGLTLFGLELLGFNFSGESQTIVQEAPRQPQVVWGAPEWSHHEHGHKGAGVRVERGQASARPSEPRAGLRIRLGS
ncbi:MAG: hypothetical protein IT318_19135 [Anaerolineales bacterium]|nr:hypothetical protein [Anaerolineales bacterium]